MSGEIRKTMYAISIGSFALIMVILFMAESSKVYDADYNKSTLEKYNKLEEINNISESIRDRENTTLSTNPLDVLGDLFKSGYQSVRLTKTTVDIADDMASNGIDDAQLGESGKYLKIMLGSLIVIFIIGAIIKVLINRDW